MADKEIKFTNEELKELAGIQTGYNNLQTQMGQTRMQLIGAKKQLEALEDLEVRQVEQLEALQKQEGEIADKLNAKYGPGSLDPATGVFTPAPKEEEAPAEEAAEESK